jgi:hypothetical protein
MKIQSEWLILLFVALFLLIPMSTIAGLFEVVLGLVVLLAIGLLVMLILLALQRKTGGSA